MIIPSDCRIRGMPKVIAFVPKIIYARFWYQSMNASLGFGDRFWTFWCIIYWECSTCFIRGVRTNAGLHALALFFRLLGISFGRLTDFGFWQISTDPSRNISWFWACSIDQLFYLTQFPSIPTLFPVFSFLGTPYTSTLSLFSLPLLSSFPVISFPLLLFFFQAFFPA